MLQQISCAIRYQSPESLSPCRVSSRADLVAARSKSPVVAPPPQILGVLGDLPVLAPRSSGAPPRTWRRSPRAQQRQPPSQCLPRAALVSSPTPFRRSLQGG